MKNQGWIKLYRKTIENWVWKHDRNAWQVFEWLLMVVDKRTGTYSLGRFRGAKATGLAPSTFHDSLMRLEKYGMATISPTAKPTGQFTFVHITNFAQYQGIIEVSKNELSPSYPHEPDRLPDTQQEEHRKELLKDFSKQIGEFKGAFLTNHIVN
jgi:hypothetical protein